MGCGGTGGGWMPGSWWGFLVGAPDRISVPPSGGNIDMDQK